MIDRKRSEEGRQIQRMAEQAVRERLEDLIRRSGEDYASLSRRIGRNPAYIQQFIKRGVPRRLNEIDRRTLARHFNVPESFLGAPEGLPEAPPGDPPGPPGGRALLVPLSSARPVRDEEDAAGELQPAPGAAFLLIPFLPAGGRAQAGDAGGDPAGARTLALDQAAARQLAAGRLSALRALRIDSDSMLPTFAAGDEVLVDCDDRRRLRDGIYVILSEGVPLVKRLSVHPVTKRLSVISDNPAYPSFADCDPERVRVIGRVVWVGRRLA